MGIDGHRLSIGLDLVEIVSNPLLHGRRERTAVQRLPRFGGIGGIHFLIGLEAAIQHGSISVAGDLSALRRPVIVFYAPRAFKRARRRDQSAAAVPEPTGEPAA